MIEQNHSKRQTEEKHGRPSEDRVWKTCKKVVVKQSHRRIWLLMTIKISERCARCARVAAVIPVCDVTAKLAPQLNNNATMSKLPLLTALTQTQTPHWMQLSKELLSSIIFTTNSPSPRNASSENSSIIYSYFKLSLLQCFVLLNFS